MMASTTEKARENKKRCDKGYLQGIRFFADFPAPGKKSNESVRKKGRATDGQCGISTAGWRSG
jgi:hypothetical protein